MRDGVIPPNRSLDCVDDELASSAHFVWPRETLRLGEKFPLKAGLVTSLGFGHVSGLIALVHPQAFLAALSPEERKAYTEQASARVLAGSSAGVRDRRWAADVRAARRPSLRPRVCRRSRRKRRCCSTRPPGSAMTIIARSRDSVSAWR